MIFHLLIGNLLNMEIKIQYIVNLFMTAAPLIIFAVIFLLTPLPDSKKIGKFSTSLRILSLSYFCLATFCIYRKCEVIDAPFLVTSSIQAYLLAFSHLNMTNPSLLNYKYVLKIISPMSLMTIIYCIIAPFYPHVILTHGSMINPFSPDCAWITSEGIQWEVAIRVIWLICYILNILYLIVIYKKEYDEYQNRLDNFSSEMPLTNFRLINTSFFLIVFIGIDSVFVTFTNGSPTILNIMLNLFMLILYFAVGFIYLQYPKSFFVIKEVIPNANPDAENDEFEDNDFESEKNTDISEDKWNKWKDVILSKKLYLQQGITIIQVAQELGTNRTYLSNSLHQMEDMNFNTYINSLRIRDAQNLLRNTDYSLSDICNMVGYSDSGNFSRQFKKIVGESPACWRKKK